MSRLRDSSDQAAWREFQDRYRELLLRYCRRTGLQHADAEDVVQSVFCSLSGSLPRFTYDPQRGRFHDYLYRCVKNGISHWAARPEAGLARLDTSVAGSLAGDGGEPAADAVWEEEWVSHHYRLAMETVRTTFEARSVDIFDRSVAGAEASELAAEFGISADAVRKVRQRIRDRMQELVAQQVKEEDE